MLFKHANNWVLGILKMFLNSCLACSATIVDALASVVYQAIRLFNALI